MHSISFGVFSLTEVNQNLRLCHTPPLQILEVHWAKLSFYKSLTPSDL